MTEPVTGRRREERTPTRHDTIRNADPDPETEMTQTSDTVRDAVTMEADYQRRAKAAVDAAGAALGPQYDTATRVAKIEAVGRIASALILADRGQP